MPENQRYPRNPRKSEAIITRGVPLREVPESVRLERAAMPVRIERPPRIHPRHLLPFVAEGVERGIHSTSPRAMIAPAAAAPGSPVKILLNTPIIQPEQQRTAGTVGEPSVAVHGDVVLFTGNWYAALSTDGGKTFGFMDPKQTERPTDHPGVTFCCDQVAHYIPQIDTFVWLLQYGPDTGDNIQRLGFARTADIATNQWRFFDLTTQILEAPEAFMDFPDLAVGANHLYVTTNVFVPGWRPGSAVFRIPIEGIRSGNPTVEKFVSTELDSFRVAQSCGTTAYFAAHKDRSTLMVYAWPEADAQPTPIEVPVALWRGNQGYVSRTPDGRRWLDRADPRITGATMAGGELWFAWSVDRGSNQRPRPFVQAARIAAHDLSIIDNVNVFDPDSATAYPALATNARGEVAITYMVGGAVPPSHVVGILSGALTHLTAGAGGRGPLPNPRNGHFEWGDYLTVRPVSRDGNLFAAAGYSLLGTIDGETDATPRYVVFGRTQDVDGVTAGGGGAGGGTGTVGGTVADGGGGGTPSPGLTGPPGEGPVSNVNTLHTVSPQVAAAIKQACGIGTGPLPQAVFPQELAPPLPELVTAPGHERWPVKTGTDDDVALVGKNIINGHDFGPGIVETTVEELARMPRPASMANIHTNPPGFLKKRARPAETVIWRIEATIFVLKLEKDGDYHLGLNGSGGKQMIAEVPTASKVFLGNSPWLANIREARQMVDDKFVSHLSPHDFVPVDGILVPRESVSPELQPQSAPLGLPRSFVAAEGEEIGIPAFQTAVKPTRARITGVGFFDRVHGQTGVSQSNGIELHPVLKIEWL